MSKTNLSKDSEKYFTRGPLSKLEMQFIEEYLLSKGYSKKKLQELPEKKAKRLMKAACLYASLKLADVESKARFSRKSR